MNYHLKMGYQLWGTEGTSQFFSEKGLLVSSLSLPEIVSKIESNQLDLFINIPKNVYSNNNNTNGFTMRRTCLDYSIPVITNIKCARLFVSSLVEYQKNGIDYTSWNDYQSHNRFFCYFLIFPIRKY